MGEFSVSGKQAVVVGAATSGVAAAELLSTRGAHVTLTDLRTDVEPAARLRAAGVALELGGHREDTFTRARSGCAESRRAAASAGDRGGTRGRRAHHGRGRAGVAVAAWSARRGHRHEGQVDDDDVNGPHA